MTYSIYDPLSNSMFRKAYKGKQLKKYGVTKKNKDVTGIDAVYRLYGSYPENSQPRKALELCFPVLFIEDCWRRNGREVVFIKNMETTEQILNIKYDVKDSTHLLENTNTFSIALPYDPSNTQQVPSGILVNIMHDDENDENNLSNFFVKLFGDTDEDDNDEHLEFKEPMINIVYASTITVKDSANKSMTSMTLSQLTKLVNIDYTSNPREYREKIVETLGTNMEDFNRKEEGLITGEPFIDNELESLVPIYRIVLATLMCKIAVPSAIHEGMPGNHLQIKQSDKGNKWLTLGNPRNTTIMHYRNGHFRQLMHERFYKGEHKDKTKGSRIIFVKDTIVGAGEDVETKTVK